MSIILSIPQDTSNIHPTEICPTEKHFQKHFHQVSTYLQQRPARIENSRCFIDAVMIGIDSCCIDVSRAQRTVPLWQQNAWHTYIDSDLSGASFGRYLCPSLYRLGHTVSVVDASQRTRALLLLAHRSPLVHIECPECSLPDPHCRVGRSPTASRLSRNHATPACRTRCRASREMPSVASKRLTISMSALSCSMSPALGLGALLAPRTI